MPYKSNKMEDTSPLFTSMYSPRKSTTKPIVITSIPYQNNQNVTPKSNNILERLFF